MTRETDTRRDLPPGWRRRVALALSIVPGAGHAYGGRLAAAVAWQFLVWAAYLLLPAAVIVLIGMVLTRDTPDGVVLLAILLSLLAGPVVHFCCARSAGNE